jgi:hypothetical protein
MERRPTLAACAAPWEEADNGGDESQNPAERPRGSEEELGLGESEPSRYTRDHVSVGMLGAVQKEEGHPKKN